MKSSKSILKSTSLIGGSQVVSIIFRIIKGKFIAVLLGPSGTGLIAALESTLQLVQKVAGLGLENSAVRDIAKAKSRENEVEVSATIHTLRRAVFMTGIFGMGLAIAFAAPLSDFTFGSYEYVLEIRILSLTVFFNLIRGGQSALLQGLREIKSLAKMTIWSSFLGAAISIPVLYLFEMDGITLFLIMLSLGQLVVSWYYARQINIKKATLSLQEFVENSKDMFKLGFAFMGGGFVTLGGTYLIRVIIIRMFDLEAAGIYQAAMSVSTVYIGIILTAMGKDFYPRLAAVADDAKEEIRIINEQTEIGVYLAAPGLLFTLALAPLGIRLLYSAEFLEATIILQWMILGVFLRTIVWPMGYLFIARGRTTIFFLNQVFATGIHLGALLLFLDYFGLEGSGIAFLIMYGLHTCYIFLMARRENHFFWSRSVIKTFIVFSMIFSISFAILYFTSQWTGGVIVSLIGLVVSYFTLQKIMEVFEIEKYDELYSLLKSKFKNEKK